MSAGIRLTLYAAVLLAVFTAAYGAGSAFIPDSLVESWMQDLEQDHHEKEGA